VTLGGLPGLYECKYVRLPTPVGHPGRSGGDDKGHGETTLRRTAAEPPLCLQCHHN
jgi:hypothetical protein